MRLASFNMRQGGSNRHWHEVISHTSPDVLFVQETKSPASLASDLFDPIPAGALVWSGVEHGRWGSALWLRSGQVDTIDVPGFGGWVTGGEVTIGDESFLAFSVHLHGRESSYVATGHELLDALQPIVDGQQLILGGDWNFTTCPRAEDDPRRQRPSETEFLDRIQSEFGLQPAWRLANPTGPLPQTLRWMREPTTPYHCDGIFVDPIGHRPIARAEVLADDLWTSLSDHNPLLVELAEVPTAL